MPFVAALLVCESIDVDAKTDRFALKFPFSANVVASLPLMLPRVQIYVALTELTDPVNLELRLFNRKTKAVFLTKKAGQAKPRGPGDLVQLKVEWMNLLFPQDGEYELQLAVEGQAEPLARTLHVVKRVG